MCLFVVCECVGVNMCLKPAVCSMSCMCLCVVLHAPSSLCRPPPCSGDLRLVEKPTPTVLGPHGFENIKATIKISSTENGIIFENIGKLSSLPNWCSE